jgi:hypothetical protein
VLPSGKKAVALDLGSLLNLSMANAPIRHGGFFKLLLYPSFTTYNIKHTHQLRWELKLTVAGKSTMVSNVMDVTLVPLPATWVGERGGTAGPGV